MSGGFIDPHAPVKRRLDRLEAVIAEVLPQMTLDDLSPRAQEIVRDLLSENAVRQERGRRAMRRAMDTDPLPAPAVVDPEGEDNRHG